MIQELYNYRIECDGGCGSKREVSSIYQKDDDMFAKRIDELYGWKMFKTPIMTPRGFFAYWEYKLFCFDTPCDKIMDKYIASISERNK